MQQVIRINEIKRRASLIGVSLPTLCRNAGVVASTVYRWLDGTQPGLRNYDEACTALETALARLERERLHELASRHADAQRVAS